MDTKAMLTSLVTAIIADPKLDRKKAEEAIDEKEGSRLMDVYLETLYKGAVIDEPKYEALSSRFAKMPVDQLETALPLIAERVDASLVVDSRRGVLEDQLKDINARLEDARLKMEPDQETLDFWNRFSITAMERGRLLIDRDELQRELDGY